MVCVRVACTWAHPQCSDLRVTSRVQERVTNDAHVSCTPLPPNKSTPQSFPIRVSGTNIHSAAQAANLRVPPDFSLSSLPTSNLSVNTVGSTSKTCSEVAYFPPAICSDQLLWFTASWFHTSITVFIPLLSSAFCTLPLLSVL